MKTTFTNKELDDLVKEKILKRDSIVVEMESKASYLYWQQFRTKMYNNVDDGIYEVCNVRE